MPMDASKRSAAMASDEASGAWFGLRAIQYAQYALDGRAPADALAQALLAACDAHDREALIAWLARARQADYAALAPVVLTYRDHPFLEPWFKRAGIEIGRMVAALDPAGGLPIALTGGLGLGLASTVAPPLRARLVDPAGDSAVGALHLARRAAGQA
jgi:glucosamine kinase